MSGFVGTRARKKKRNFIILIITIILIIVFYLVLPSINFTKEELLPEEKILPDNNENISSLASNVEELRTIIFQKDTCIMCVTVIKSPLFSENRKMYNEFILKSLTVFKSESFRV